jgi:hypothetical protein
MIKTQKVYYDLHNSSKDSYTIYDFRFKEEENSPLLDIILIKTKITKNNERNYEVYFENGIDVSPHYYMMDDVINFCIKNDYMEEENLCYDDEEFAAGMVFTFGERAILCKLCLSSPITKEDLFYYLYDNDFLFSEECFHSFGF